MRGQHFIHLYHTILLQDSQDLLSGQESDLRNTVLVSQGDTDLRRSQTYEITRE